MSPKRRIDVALDGGPHTEPGSGIAAGSVGQGSAPSGYYWDRLADAAGDRDKLDALADELDTHGYTRGGQLMTAVLAAYDETGAKRARAGRRG
jgi:hypothetical protein